MVINRDDLRVEALVPASVLVKGARGKRAEMVAPQGLAIRAGRAAASRRFGLVIEGGMAWLGARAGGGRDHQASQVRRGRGDSPATPDAGRRPARARSPQRRQRVGRAGPGQRHRLSPGAHAARPARVRGRAAPASSSSPGWAMSKPSTTARAPTWAPRWPRSWVWVQTMAPGKLVVILGGDGKGQDFSPLVAPVTRYARAVSADRSRRRHRGHNTGRHGRDPAAPCRLARGHALVL